MCAFKRSKRNDSERVDVLMRPKVVCFHVMPVACFFDTWKREHSLNKGLQIRIIDDSTQIALEMDDIHQIEPSKGWEQANICLGELAISIANQPFSTFEEDLQFIEPCEERSNCFLLCFLCTSKTGFVNSIVDRFIICIDHCIDVLA